jgi:hydrogenase nickel incorporation protein HypB
MVMKHPFIFIDADVVVINKADLAQAMKADVKKLEMDVKRIKPNAKVAVTNCRSGEGVRKVVEALDL